jgi:DNA-binding LacI/PurR family transcriptional regulator
MIKHVSLQSVSKKAKVSVTTASFVLSGRGKEYRVSEATMEIVREAAMELGYLNEKERRRIERQNDLFLFAQYVQLPDPMTLVNNFLKEHIESIHKESVIRQSGQ